MMRIGELVVAPFRDDLAAWQRNGWSETPIGKRKALRMLFQQPGLRATLLHRMAHWAQDRHIPALPTLLAQMNVAYHAIELPPSVRIGGGLYMPHTVGTVINAWRIGRDVTIQGGVTVGLRKEPVFPIIEDGVYLAAGCRILGEITLGAGAVAGANAVVLHDVAAGVTVVGVPARPLPKGSLAEEETRAIAYAG